MSSGPLASLRRTLRKTSWGQGIRNSRTRPLPKVQPPAPSHQSPTSSGSPEPSSLPFPAAAAEPPAEPTEASAETAPSGASAPEAGSEAEYASSGQSAPEAGSEPKYAPSGQSAAEVGPEVEEAPSEEISVCALSLEPPFPGRLQELAEANPGGWVYDVEGKARAGQPVPVESVLGAWRIDENGVPTGEYVTNLTPSRAPPTRVGTRRRIAALAALTVVIAAIVLVVLLSSSMNQASRAGPGQSGSLAQPGQATPAPTRRRPRRRARPHHRPVVPAIARVHLEVSALARVWVCLQDARGRLPIDGMVLTAGVPPIRLVSRSFRLYLGNTSVAVQVNGTLQSLAANSGPIAYLVTPQGIKALSDTNPPCR